MWFEVSMGILLFILLFIPATSITRMMPFASSGGAFNFAVVITILYFLGIHNLCFMSNKIADEYQPSLLFIVIPSSVTIIFTIVMLIMTILKKFWGDTTLQQDQYYQRMRGQVSAKNASIN